MRLTYRYVFGAAALAALSALVACSEPPPGRHVLVFVDRSCSVTESILDGYRADWTRVVGGLEAGDRLTMGPITAETYTSFRPVIDEQRPIARPFLGNKFRDEAQARNVRQRMLEAFDGVQRLPCSQRTPVLDAVSLAGKLLSPNASDRVLIMLSDMMEDAEGLRFDRTPASARLAQRIVDSRRRAGVLPDLHGAEVYVSGAAAGISNRDAQRLEQFWQTYFTAVGGQTREYRPALLGFGPSPEMGSPRPVQRRETADGGRYAGVEKDRPWYRSLR